MSIIDKLRKGVQDITGKTIEAKVADYSEVYGEVLLGLDRELETARGKLVRLQEAAERGEAEQREATVRLSRLEEAEAARHHEADALREQLELTTAALAALREEWAERERLREEREQGQRRAMKRLLLWAVAAGALGAGLVEAVMVWIRG